MKRRRAGRNDRSASAVCRHEHRVTHYLLRGTSWQCRQRASYDSLPPTRMIGVGLRAPLSVLTDSSIIGIVVDAVSEVVAVPVSSILPLPAEVAAQDAGARNRSRYLQAVVQRPSGVAAMRRAVKSCIARHVGSYSARPRWRTSTSPP